MAESLGLVSVTTCSLVYVVSLFSLELGVPKSNAPAGRSARSTSCEATVTDDVTPELVRDVEQALAGINFGDDPTLFHTFEALHDLSHTVGDLFIDEVHAGIARLAELTDAGEIREYVAEWDGAMRLRFVAWMREHHVPFLRWWVLHSTGIYLLWEIHAQ